MLVSHVWSHSHMFLSLNNKQNILKSNWHSKGMTKPGTFFCAVEANKVRKKEKICGITAKLETEEKQKEAGSVPSLKRRLPRALGQMVMSPRGCFVSWGPSSACETLWNKAELNHLSQSPDSTGRLCCTTPLCGCYYWVRRPQLLLQVPENLVNQSGFKVS